MPENEFEKVVQQKMDGLKLTPGNAIWENVAAKISAQKSRRRPAILTLVLLCCLLAATMVVTDLRQTYFSAPGDIATANLPVKITSDTGNSNIITSVEKNIRVEKTGRGDSNAIKKMPASKDQYYTTQQTLKESDVASELPLALNKKQQAPVKKTHEATGSKLFQTQAGEMEETAGESSNNKENVPLKPLEEIDYDTLATEAKNIISTDSVSQATAIKKLTTRPVSDTSIAVKKQHENKQVKKWQLGIVFTAGQASTASGYLASSAGSSYADLIFSSPSYTASNNQSGQIINSSYSPSKIKPAAGFTVGISATRKLSTKTNFVAALTYKLFTTSKLTGGDSLANGSVFYAVGSTNSYRNSFHFIEVPFTLQTQFARIKSKLVLLEAGVTFSQLISSNALQYDISRNKYYVDNQLLNKTIIGFSAALSVNLLDKNKPALLVGPQFYYSLTSVANSGLYAKTHYSFIGIKLQKTLKKN